MHILRDNPCANDPMRNRKLDYFLTFIIGRTFAPVKGLENDNSFEYQA